MSADYTIGPMRSSEFKACCENAAEAFCTANALVTHLGITREAWAILEKHLMDGQVENGLSLVARDANNQPLAFVFMKPFAIGKAPDEVMKAHPGVPVCFRIMEKMYERAAMRLGAFGLGSLVSGKTAYIATLGTYPAAQGKGLAKKICQKAFEVAKEKGFNRVIVEPGHAASIKIFEDHLQFRPVETTVAADFMMDDGSKPFADLDRKHIVKLMEYKLKYSFVDSVVCWPFALLRLVWQSSAPGATGRLALFLSVVAVAVNGAMFAKRKGFRLPGK